MFQTVLISDQPVLLHGFEHVLQDHGFRVVTSGPSHALAVVASSIPSPDLMLLDVTGGLTFENLSELHILLPRTPVVLWGDTLPLDLVFKTLEYGVRGIVQRTASPDQLVEALRKVASGEMQIGFNSPHEGPAARRNVSLTPRERQIIGLLRQGLRNKQIAAEMNITEGTVKIYLFRLFHKLGVRNRFELARSAVVDRLQSLSSASGSSAARRVGPPDPSTHFM